LYLIYILCNSIVYPNYNFTIGKPYYNYKVYILDTSMNPLPIGATGELYIGGVGLARGYLNRPELTAEKFIANPFQTEEEQRLNKNTRLYKTGDLARWLPDGNIEYIGRNDFQVKIRGYRIELGEIENALLSYSAIKQSAVLVKEYINTNGSDNKYLVGYYVSDNKLNEEDIFNYLQTRLPEYMVPSMLVHLEKLPLTINGKLDRKALPDPEFSNEDSYVAPRNELEQKVCQIWAKILGAPEDKVGIYDDFFRLGGNSILAIKLVSKLNRELNSNISVSGIFTNNTIDKSTRYIEHSTEDNIVIEKATTNRVEEQALSFAQERLWFIEKYEQGTSAYNVPMVFKLASNVKLDILESSVGNIILRHEILRTLIKEDSEGNSYQIVLDDDQATLLEIMKVRIRNHLQLDQELKKEVNHIYDLSNECPIRVCLYEIADVNYNHDSEYYLSIVAHHIAFDGWSIDILVRELNAHYNYYLNKEQGLETDLDLPELDIQYKDFSLWQRSYLSGERLNKQLSYWKDKLDGYETLNLVIDKPRPSQIDYNGRDIYFEIDKETSNTLRELAKELKVSLYSVLLSAYYLMLRSYSNQDDIVIGTPIANRHFSQIENLIGFFVNSLALRIQIDSGELIKEFIQRVGSEVVGAQLHQDLPFEKLVENLKIVKDTSRHPIFQVMFGVQGFGAGLYNLANEQTTADLTNLLQDYKPVDSLYNVAKLDMSTFIDDSQTCLKGSFNYRVSLYAEETIIRFIESYTEILRQIAGIANNSQKQEQIKITNLNYLNQEQYKKIIHTWNNTDKDYPKNKTIQILFEEQVEKTPDNIAVIFEERKLTYRELNEKANQLARYIRQTHDIKPDTLIALCLDRSEHILIAILAVLKTGGAYVPMDPNYPDERVQYILKDTNTKIVLTNEIHRQRLENLITISQTTILGIDGLQEQLKTQTSINLKIDTDRTNLVYVIYTSGTTGNPKGVMIDHENISNYIWNIKQHIQLSSEDRIDFSTNIGFDLTVTTTLCSLCLGSQVVVYSNQLQDLDSYKRYLLNSNINVIKLVPSYFELLIDFLPNTKINKVILGGEKLTLTIINKAKELHEKNNIKVYDEYGPTETTVGACVNQVYPEGNSTIGKPYHNYKVYVLDANLIPLPIGAIGELYIGGMGVARGYLNRPDLTAERFIINPFQTEEEKKKNENGRIYKTGDLVRWLVNGNLEYIGRNDFQVKIRGYRIELGEIESVLLNYKDIRQSVVLAKEYTDVVATSNKYLVGYYVSDNKLNAEDVLNYLQTQLPEYMVPTTLMYLEKLPLTINGKLDKKALAEAQVSSSDNYIAPRNELEKKLSIIWGELLGLKTIGINDNFFRLGGNSITAIKLVSSAKNKGIEFSVKDVFGNSTIYKLANWITEQNNTNLKIPLPLLHIEDIKSNIATVNINKFNQKNQEVNNILLTGATGFLGRYLLLDLLDYTKANIYCIVRSADQTNSQEKLNKTLVSLGYEKYVNEPRIICIEGDLSKPYLGLNPDTVENLESNIDTIYHCGANVHHLHTYEELRNANVLSTLELLRISTAKKIKQLHFISTIGTISSSDKDIWKPGKTPISTIGYTQSKWVCEKILWSYIEKNYPVYIYRPGNITGHTTTGFCMPENNHALLLLKGFIQLGVAPKWNMPFEMVPVDQVSKAIVSLSLKNPRKSNNAIFNLHNPTSINWETYMRKIDSIANLKMTFVNSEEFRLNILPNIDLDNALYPLKTFYESPFIKSKTTEFIKDRETQKQLKALQVNYPIAKDYDKLLKTYLMYLLKINFLQFTEKNCNNSYMEAM